MPRLTHREEGRGRTCCGGAAEEGKTVLYAEGNCLLKNTQEMLTRDDMIRLLGDRPFEEKGEFHKYFGGTVVGGNSVPGPPGVPDDNSLPGGPTPTPAFKENKL